MDGGFGSKMNLGSPTLRFAGWGLVQQNVQPSSAVDKAYHLEETIGFYPTKIWGFLSNLTMSLGAFQSIPLAAKFTRMKSWGIPFGGDERDLVGFAVVSHYSAYIFNISMHIVYIYDVEGFGFSPPVRCRQP